MKFSLGLWDSLFGKRVKLEIPTEDGEVIKRDVSEKWLRKMEEEKKFSRLIKTNILDPIKGVYVEYWSIGKEIDENTYNQFKDENSNEIYILNVYEEGKLNTFLLKKEMWEDTKIKMESV